MQSPSFETTTTTTTNREQGVLSDDIRAKVFCTSEPRTSFLVSVSFGDHDKSLEYNRETPLNKKQNRKQQQQQTFFFYIVVFASNSGGVIV